MLSALRTLIVAALLLVIAPAGAFAFCGFYVAGGDAALFNDATQVALVRDGTRTVLSMQNSYQGPPEAFAIVVPVPQVLDEANVKTLDKEVFDRLDQMTAPRLVEYWEANPCKQSSIFARTVRTKFMYANEAVASAVDFGVTVESQFAVGEYDVVVLSADDSSGLDAFLRANHYNVPLGAEPYLRPYVEQGSYFFVAKVDPKRAKFEGSRAVLSPLRFEYASEEFRLPIRLGMINSQGEQDLIVYTIGRGQRYEVANYPNAFIPTNIEVVEDVEDNFGEFYQSLFAATVAKNPGAVITEYSWQFSGCDPCPTTPLGASEAAALGMTDAGYDGMFGDPMGAWTVTRLHARYAPDDVGEDLTFRKAESVVGGREIANSEGALEQRTVANGSGGLNQFQGRYIIRHRWKGPIMCLVPKFGDWSGTPRTWGGKATSKKPTRFLESPNTSGAPPSVVEEYVVDDWLDQGVPELAISGSTPTPFSRSWLAYIWGYGLGMLILGVVLYLLRKLRQRSTWGFVGATLVMGCGGCCSLAAGDLALILWALGSGLILSEGVLLWWRARGTVEVDELSP